MTQPFGGVGGALTFSSASGGKIYEANSLTTTASPIAPANTARQRITFHNPGDVDFFIAPMFQQNNGSNVALAPNPSALGGCFRVFANGGTLVIEGECQGAWQAFSASGANNPITVMDSNH